jgi:hypothetical protein
MTSRSRQLARYKQGRRQRLTMVRFEPSWNGFEVRITYPDRTVKEQEVNREQASELYHFYRAQGAVIVGKPPRAH